MSGSEVTTGGIGVMDDGCYVSGTLRSNTIQISSIVMLEKILQIDVRDI